MKTTLLMATVLILACLPASGVNLLVNGGFEDGPITGIPDDPIPGWTQRHQEWVGVIDYHWLVQSDEKYSGSYALKLYQGPEGWGAAWGVSQTVTVSFGRVYEVSGMWKSTDANATARNIFHLFMILGNWYEPTGVDADTSLYGLKTAHVAWNHPPIGPIPFEWEGMENSPYTAYPPTGVLGTERFRSRMRALGTKITVYLLVNTTGNDTVTYFDDVALEEVNAAYSVAGYVKTPGGQAIAGATVTCSTGGSATTDAAGYYKIYYPDAGSCSLVATAPHYFDLTQPATLGARTDVAVNLTMTPKPTGTLTGTVTAGGSPVPNASVTTTTGGYATTANGSGVYTMDVEAGDYTVEAVAPGYLTASTPATVITGQTTVANLALTLRPINPANALTNGDFEAGMDPWTMWTPTHFTDHKKYEPTCPGYIDQWIGNTCDVAIVPGDGYAGSTGIRVGLTEGPGNWGACGGVRQECYVTPGKYYRVRAMFKGNLASDAQDYNAGVGLIDGRFDPGVYTDIANPPPHVDDCVLMVSHPDQYFGSQPKLPLPEPLRWWHNLMELRSMGYHGLSSWDWDTTLNYIAPRNYLASAIKRATGEKMTVALYCQMLQWDNPSRTEYAVFDNVVLEEVAGPAEIKLGDLTKVDLSPPYGVFPDQVPQVAVDLSGNAKPLTSQFMDENSSYFYIEETDRSAGIRVDYSQIGFIPVVGDKVSLTGILGWTQTPDLQLMERRIVSDSGSLVSTAGAEMPVTLGIQPHQASAKLPYWNPLAQAGGPANTGLLATTWGRVTNTYGPDSLGLSWLQVDDGSGVEFWVRAPLPEPDASIYAGQFVKATGTIGITWAATIYPVMTLQVREETVDDDFAVITP